MVEGYYWEQDSHDGCGQVLTIESKKNSKVEEMAQEKKIDIFSKKSEKKLSVQDAV